MEQRKIPAEAVQLYTDYIHGEVSRRDFLAGVQRFAVAGLTAAALTEALMPNYALGQQVAKDDERITATYETVSSPDGNGFISGYLVRPFGADSRSDTSEQLPGIVVIHENRGLNPHTEDVARRFALENFMAFAPDALATVGGYPGDDYRGGQLFRGIDRPRLTQDFSRRLTVVESTSGLHGEHWRNRFLLRRRHVQYLGGTARGGSGGGRPVLWRRARRVGRAANLGGDANSPRRAR